MQKQFILLLGLFVATTTAAQNIFPTTGNAGIGTATPTAPLHITGVSWDKLLIQETGTTGLGRITFTNSSNTFYVGTVGSTFTSIGHVKQNSAFLTYDGANGMSIAAGHYDAAIRLYTGGIYDEHERFRIDNVGKMYAMHMSRVSTNRDSIVSMDPSTKELQVAPLRPSRMRFVDNRSSSTSPINYNSSFQTLLKSSAAINITGEGTSLFSVFGIRGGAADSTGKAHELAFSESNQVWFRSGYNAGWGGWKKIVLDSAGVVRIGTTANRAELHVNGEVYSRKVKVTQNNWPDYVFDPTYHLPSLYEVEAYIKKFKHLPDVPSAAIVETDGLDLGEGQTILLKKIEELTLYTIQQQKQIDDLVTQNTILLQQLQELANRINHKNQ